LRSGQQQISGLVSNFIGGQTAVTGRVTYKMIGEEAVISKYVSSNTLKIRWGTAVKAIN
jgi:hypothetical protein